MLRVDPVELAATAAPLREVADVARELDAVRPELTEALSRSGSEAVSRSAESFLQSWATGLRGVSDRAEVLAGQVHTAAGEYQAAEARMRGHLAGGAP